MVSGKTVRVITDWLLSQRLWAFELALSGVGRVAYLDGLLLRTEDFVHYFSLVCVVNLGLLPVARVSPVCALIQLLRSLSSYVDLSLPWWLLRFKVL